MNFEKLIGLGIKLRKKSGQEKTVCPQCSDGRRNKKDPCLSVNVTEGTYNCHNCGWKGNVKSFAKKENRKIYEKPDQNMLKSIELNEKIVSWFESRKISKETLEKFFIHGKTEWMPQTQKNENCIVFPYMREGQIVNAKYRDGRKNFRMVKDAELILFGMQTLRGRHCAIITEGEIDCLSAYEAGFGQDYPQVADENGELVEHELGRWAVLSVPNGASKGSQQLEYLDNCAEWLSEVDEFIIAVDNDEPGKTLRDELIRRLGVEKCRIVDWDSLQSLQTHGNAPSLTCKDLNEVLTHFGKEAAKSLLIASNAIPVDGVYFVDDIFGQMLSNFKKGVQLAPTTRFTEMDEYFRWKKGDITLCTGYGNSGKALCIETPIPTINGWKKMGELKVGDKIFDENGDICSVTYATPIMHNRECFKITFSDNTTVIADAEHLWFTHTEASRLSEKKKTKNGGTLKVHGTNQEHKRVKPKVRTTKEIINTIYNYRKDGRRLNNHSIDNCKPIKTEEKKLLIHPYCLGAWLGDGTSCSSGFTSNDIEIIDFFNFYGYKTTKRKQKYSYGIHSNFFYQLKELNLLKNKHIPIDYLRGSISQRMDLLKGLMDTDGYIDKNGICEFTNTKKVLAENVYELITSLGFKATIKESDAYLNGKIVSKKYRIAFKPNVCVFNLKRKASRHKNKCKNNWRYIKSIEPIDSVPVRCITVDSLNSMYLCTKSFIPTHNTFFMLQMMLTKSIWDGWKWAVFSPENYPANDFYDDMVEMYTGKWLSDMTEDEYVEACRFINDHIFYVYPENEHDIYSVHEKFRYLILKKGVDGVMIDPFNQLDKNQKPYERDDQYLSLVLKDIKRFALLNNVVYVIVAHPKNPTYNQDRSLPVPDMYDLHGGSMWGNKSDQILAYYRPRFHEDKNSPEVEIYVQKLKRKRTGGKLGRFDLTLSWAKKRYVSPTGEMPCDPNYAKRKLLTNQTDYTQKEIGLTEWKPIDDVNDTDIGF